MKVCLKSRQTKQYLLMADEIKVQYRDIEQIFDLANEYENKNIILENTHLDDPINWDKVKKLSVLCSGKGNKLILCLSRIGDIATANSYKIASYWGFPINTFYELNGLINTYGDFKPKYVCLGAPLTHQIPTVKKVLDAEIGIRIVPNRSYTDQFFHADGVCGSWVRPEDLDFYVENGIEAIEFESTSIPQEQALYRIYVVTKEWPGQLGQIVSDLNYLGKNRLIRSDLAEKRISCGQKCLYGGMCRLCYRLLDLTELDLEEIIANKK